MLPKNEMNIKDRIPHFENLKCLLTNPAIVRLLLLTDEEEAKCLTVKQMNAKFFYLESTLPLEENHLNPE